MDNEDKAAWCKQGEAHESLFLRSVAPLYGLDLVINPEKARDKYAIDFISPKTGVLVDLKHVETPFFSSSKHGYDPNHTVTFNHKDYLHYMDKSPEWAALPMWVLFWVDWPEQTDYGVTAQKMNGVWTASIHQIDWMIRNNKLRNHEYQNRGKETGTNAKSSWLLDLRTIQRLKTATERQK